MVNKKLHASSKKNCGTVPSSSSAQGASRERVTYGFTPSAVRGKRNGPQHITRGGAEGGGM